MYIVHIIAYTCIHILEHTCIIKKKSENSDTIEWRKKLSKQLRRKLKAKVNLEDTIKDQPNLKKSIF